MRRFTTSIACKEILGGALLLIFSTVCVADQSATSARVTNAAVNLMETDLVKKKDLLDCQLRLEGTAPNYKLVYSLGEISIPVSAVKKNYEDSYVLLAVKASLYGLPVTEILIRYHKIIGGKYELDLQCHKGVKQCEAPVAYVLLVRRPEKIALSILRRQLETDLIVDSAQSEDVNPRAIMIRDRSTLVSPAMDGLTGAKNISASNVHYVCATE